MTGTLASWSYSCARIPYNCRFPASNACFHGIGVVVNDAVPGFVPRILVDPDIGLFRADERVFTAMLDGWSAQMLARGLTTETIKQRCQLLERFQRFTGEFPR